MARFNLRRNTAWMDSSSFVSATHLPRLRVRDSEVISKSMGQDKFSASRL